MNQSICLLVCALAATSCMSPPLYHEDATQLSTSTPDASHWIAVASSSEIHPASHIKKDELLLWVEILDQHGHPMKTAHSLWCETLSQNAFQRDNNTPAWLRWRDEANTNNQQQAHYDPLLGAYLYRFHVPFIWRTLIQNKTLRIQGSVLLPSDTLLPYEGTVLP